MELESMPVTGTPTESLINTLEESSADHALWSKPLDLYSLVPYPEDYWARAETRQCFASDESNVKVTWTEVNSENNVAVRTLTSTSEIHAWTAESDRPGSGLRIISVSQTNSWKPLKMTREMFQKIIDIAEASSEVLEYPLAFCRKVVAAEEAFSCAPIIKSTNHSIEIAYVMKYAWWKPVEDGQDPWGVRQTAVYQKYDTETNQSTWIFLNPTPNCAFQNRLATLIQDARQVLAIKRQPLLIHSALVGTFFPLWRDYLANYERKVLNIANTAMASRPEEDLRVNYETLGSIRHAESCCLSLEPIFRSLRKALQTLDDVNYILTERNITQQSDAHAMKQLLNNYMNMVDAYTQQASFLKNRAACLAVSITDTLSFKDSNTAKRQSQYMLDLTLSTVDDSTTVRVITIVTLIYLPFTFMATLLGMNSFFAMDPNGHNLIVSHKFWIYVVFSVPLTAATLSYWWFLKNAKQRTKSKSDEDSMERGSMHG